MSERLYDQHYCAFLDILGFSDFVSSAFRSRSKVDQRRDIDRLSDLNEQIEKELLLIKRKNRAIRFSHFSDSIFLSIPAHTEDAIGQLFYRIQRISTALLIRGFLTRGAVVLGLVHYRNGTVFGPALIDAYRLESQVAKHPGIMIAKSVRDGLTEESDARTKLLWSENGPVYLNCLQLFEHLALDTHRGYTEVLSNPKSKARLEFLRGICEFIQRQIESSRDNPRVFEKVRWIANEINTRVLKKGAAGFRGWPSELSF